MICFQVLLHDLHEVFIDTARKNLSLKCDNTRCAKTIALYSYNVRLNM